MPKKILPPYKPDEIPTNSTEEEHTPAEEGLIMVKTKVNAHRYAVSFGNRVPILRSDMPRKKADLKRKDTAKSKVKIKEKP